MMATRTMPLNELQRAQLEQLRLQNERARAELNAPVGKSRFQVLLTYLPVFSVFIALWGIGWGDVSDAMTRFSRCLWAETCDRDLMNVRTRTLASKMAASMAATAKMSYSEFESNQFKYR
jgi:hypothetical protein